jgi:hypothetical protein
MGVRVIAGFQPFGGQAEQLGYGLQVPVRCLGRGMSKEGGQHRQVGLDVDAGPVPADNWVLTAKVWRRSWILGRRRLGGVGMSAKASSLAKVCCTQRCCIRCPVRVMKNAGQAASGQSRSRRVA